MKKIVIILALIVSSFSVFSQEKDLTDYEKYRLEEDIRAHPPQEEIFFIVESMPKFNNKDIKEFRKWITLNVEYPQSAIENRIEGKVFVEFVVNSHGNVINAKVIESVDPYLDAEAIRVIMASPQWTPGRQGNKNVSVKFTFPINFILDEEITDNSTIINNYYNSDPYYNYFGYSWYYRPYYSWHYNYHDLWYYDCNHYYSYYWNRYPRYHYYHYRPWYRHHNRSYYVHNRRYNSPLYHRNISNARYYSNLRREQRRGLTSANTTTPRSRIQSRTTTNRSPYVRVTNGSRTNNQNRSQTYQRSQSTTRSTTVRSQNQTQTRRSSSYSKPAQIRSSGNSSYSRPTQSRSSSYSKPAQSRSSSYSKPTQSRSSSSRSSSYSRPTQSRSSSYSRPTQSRSSSSRRR